MCPCRFISFNRCTTLVVDVDDGGGHACVGAGGIWETFVPSHQFCSEPKTALKNNKALKNALLGSGEIDFVVGHDGGGHYFSQKCAQQSLESSGLKNSDSVKIAPFLSGKEMTSCSPSPEVCQAPTAKKSLNPLASLRGCAPPYNIIKWPLSAVGGNSGQE